MSLSLVTKAEPSNRDLRRELQDAQADCTAAEGRARVAKDIFDRAAAASREASDHVARLRADMDATRRTATERAARAISEALRAGSELPLLPPRPPITPP